MENRDNIRVGLKLICSQGKYSRLERSSSLLKDWSEIKIVCEIMNHSMLIDCWTSSECIFKNHC